MNKIKTNLMPKIIFFTITLCIQLKIMYGSHAAWLNVSSGGGANPFINLVTPDHITTCIHITFIRDIHTHMIQLYLLHFLVLGKSKFSFLFHSSDNLN